MDPTPEAVASDVESRYEVTAPREVLGLLNGICEHKSLVSLLYGGGDSFLTFLLKVDQADQSIVLDSVVDASVNERATQAARVSLRTTLDNIRIIIPITGLRGCEYERKPALRADLPASLVRLQRREHYRIQTPIGKPVQAAIPMPGESGQGTVRLSLFDISCGGVALIGNAALLDETVGREYPSCQIDLPGVGVIETTLQVRESREFTLRNGMTRRRIGCQFVNPSPTILSAINRYIMKLEREQNARRAGME